jgi:hypothetical protein
MRNLAIAMLVTGGAFTFVAIGFLLRGPSAAAGLAVLVPSLFLVLAGVVTLNDRRR